MQLFEQGIRKHRSGPTINHDRVVSRQRLDELARRSERSTKQPFNGGTLRSPRVCVNFNKR
jgi:hypothetical protein